MKSSRQEHPLDFWPFFKVLKNSWILACGPRSAWETSEVFFFLGWSLFPRKNIKLCKKTSLFQAASFGDLLLNERQKVTFCFTKWWSIAFAGSCSNLYKFYYSHNHTNHLLLPHLCKWSRHWTCWIQVCFVDTKSVNLFWSISPGGTPYNGLYGEALPERDTFLRLHVYKRVGKSAVSQRELNK